MVWGHRALRYGRNEYGWAATHLSCERNSKHLLTEVGTAVNQYPCNIRLHQCRTAQAFVMFIIAFTYLAATTYHRHTNRCPCSQECQSHKQTCLFTSWSYYSNAINNEKLHLSMRFIEKTFSKKCLLYSYIPWIIVFLHRSPGQSSPSSQLLVMNPVFYILLQRYYFLAINILPFLYSLSCIFTQFDWMYKLHRRKISLRFTGLGGQ